MATDFYGFLVKVIPFTIESYFEVYQKQTQLEGLQIIFCSKHPLQGEASKNFLLIKI